MPRPSVPIDAVLLVARVLETTGIPYAFMGGLALNAWGIPRTTFDLDVVLSVEPPSWPRLVQALRAADIEMEEAFLEGYVDRLAGMEKVRCRLLFEQNWFVIDVFLATTPFLRSAMARRVAVPVDGASLYVVSSADLLLLKLVAGRRKDWVDIENILAIQGIPDRPYLESWAVRLQVMDRLQQALGGSKPPGASS